MKEKVKNNMKNPILSENICICINEITIQDCEDNRFIFHKNLLQDISLILQ